MLDNDNPIRSRLHFLAIVRSRVKICSVVSSWPLSEEFLLGRVSGIAITGSRPAKLASVIGGFNYQVIARGVSEEPVAFSALLLPPLVPPPLCMDRSFLRPYRRTDLNSFLFPIHPPFFYARIFEKIDFSRGERFIFGIIAEVEADTTVKSQRAPISLKLRPERTERCRNLLDPGIVAQNSTQFSMKPHQYSSSLSPSRLTCNRACSSRMKLSEPSIAISTLFVSLSLSLFRWRA